MVAVIWIQSCNRQRITCLSETSAVLYTIVGGSWVPSWDVIGGVKNTVITWHCWMLIEDIGRVISR